MKLWVLAIYFNIFSVITCNYFFDNYKVNGLTKRQWVAKCTSILHDSKLHQAIFDIKDLCTQLRCIRDTNNEICIGFDFCMRSSVTCEYPEPDMSLPFPECCPKRQCDGTRLMSFKKFMATKTMKGYEARVLRGNQDRVVI